MGMSFKTSFRMGLFFSPGRHTSGHFILESSPWSRPFTPGGVLVGEAYWFGRRIGTGAVGGPGTADHA